MEDSSNPGGDSKPGGATGLRKTAPYVESELYEELLNRYERMLVFAGQLQEKLRSEKLLADQNRDLEAENTRLRRVVAAGEAYMAVLEKALGVFELHHEEPTDKYDQKNRPGR